MKRIFGLMLIGFFGASLLLAEVERPRARFSNPLLDEVARLANAGSPESTIIAFIHAREARLDGAPTADDLIRLKQAGVSAKVVEYLAGISAAGSRNRENRAYVSTETASDGSDVVAYDSPGGYYYRPYPYWGWGWGFYGPFFSPGFVVRARFGFGHHHFHGHRFR